MKKRRRYNPIFGNYYNPGGALNQNLTWGAFKENVGNAPIDKQMGAAVGGAGMLAKTTGTIVGNLTMPEVEEEDFNARTKRELSQMSKSFQGYDLGRTEFDGNFLGNAVEGAMTGMSVGGPVGAAIGAGAGIVLKGAEGFASLIGNRMRSNKEDELNKNAVAALNAQNTYINQNMANSFLSTQLAYGGILPSTKNVASQLSRYNNNIFAGGGYIPNQYAYGGQFNNGVISFNTGGTHEENPYGGIMQGIGENGEPNFVEEGEVKWRDYIFSDRLKVPKEVDEFLLPKAIVNKTYADAAEYLQKESKERELDKISKLGLTTSLTKLMIAQEQQKAIEEEGEENMFKYGGVMSTGNIFDTGGFISPFYSAVDPWANSMNTYYETQHQQKIPDALNWWAQKRNPYMPQIGALGDLTKEAGLQKVSSFFPQVQKYIGEEDIKNDQKIPKIDSTEDWQNEGTLAKNSKENVPEKIKIKKIKEDKVEDVDLEKELATNTTQNTSTSENPWQGVANDALRFAPVMANIANLTNIMASKPDRIKLDRIYTPFLSDRMDYNPIDSNYMANQMAQQAASTNRHLIDSSGGNRAIAQAALLSANRGSQGAIGDAILSVNQANEEKLRFAKEFNKNVNQFNIQNSLQTQQYNAAAHQQELMWAKQSEAARRAAINQGIMALGTGIGDMATESRWMGIAPKMGQGYDANANYNAPLGSFRDYMNKAKEEREKRKAAKNTAEGNQQRFGGIIYKRKIK